MIGIGNYCHSVGEEAINVIFHTLSDDTKDEGILERVSDWACFAFGVLGFVGSLSAIGLLIRAGIEWGSYKLVATIARDPNFVGTHGIVLQRAKYTFLISVTSMVLCQIASIARRYLHSHQQKAET